MLVDDTRHRVYVHNLEDEIKQAEADEHRSIFHPDVEKKLSKIPQNVLAGGPPSTQDKQMVLYKIPVSLTVPQERDSVRKAIIESRERARAEHALKAAEYVRSGAPQSLSNSQSIYPEPVADASQHSIGGPRDPDAMDIG